MTISQLSDVQPPTLTHILKLDDREFADLVTTELKGEAPQHVAKALREHRDLCERWVATLQGIHDRTKSQLSDAKSQRNAIFDRCSDSDDWSEYDTFQDQKAPWKKGVLFFQGKVVGRLREAKRYRAKLRREQHERSALYEIKRLERLLREQA